MCVWYLLFGLDYGIRTQQPVSLSLGTSCRVQKPHAHRLFAIVPLICLNRCRSFCTFCCCWVPFCLHSTPFVRMFVAWECLTDSGRFPPNVQAESCPAPPACAVVTLSFFFFYFSSFQFIFCVVPTRHLGSTGIDITIPIRESFIKGSEPCGAGPSPRTGLISWPKLRKLQKERKPQCSRWRVHGLA